MKEISLNILDIARNSIEAGATNIKLEIVESIALNRLTIRISDDGRGIPADILEKVQDPFFTTRKTRKVGLGIPFLKQHASMCDGNLKMASEPGKGTITDVEFRLDHIDRQPLGDLSGVLRILIMAETEINLYLHYKTDSGNFVFDTREVKEVIETDRIAEPELVNELRELIRNNLESIGSEAT